MCWLAAARHYCTHCNRNGGMEERVFDSFVLSPSQLPPFTSPLIQSSKSAYFLHGPILKCSFLKTLSKIIFSNLIFIFFIFLFRIIYKINNFFSFTLNKFFWVIALTTYIIYFNYLILRFFKKKMIWQKYFFIWGKN